MIERLRQTLVESYVGVIALGYLLAQIVLHLVNIFGAPVAGWLSRNEYRQLISHTTDSGGSIFRYSLPDLTKFIVLVPVWYLLMRWLYFKPLKRETPPQTLDQNF